jgi:hypothetical protein
MTMEEIDETFERVNEDFLKFQDVANPRHPRRDLCAFMLLHELVPSDDDMVAAAEHDQIWLGVDAEAFAAVATEDIIRALSRCGVFWDSDNESLSMFR